MKALALALLAALALPGADDPQSLIGTWTLELRPVSGPLETTQFIVTAVDGNRIQGTFYGSDIVGGQVNTDGGGVWFAFEHAHSYFTTIGQLVDGEMTGTTYSRDQEYLQPWRAVRAE